MTILQAEGIIKKKLWAFGYRVKKVGELLVVDGKYNMRAFPTAKKKLAYTAKTFKGFDTAGFVYFVGRDLGEVVYFLAVRDGEVIREDSPYKVFGLPLSKLKELSTPI